MKITLELTGQSVKVGPVPARVWAGRTAGGVRVRAIIVALDVQTDADALALQGELRGVERAWPGCPEPDCGDCAAELDGGEVTALAGGGL